MDDKSEKPYGFELIMDLHGCDDQIISFLTLFMMS